MIEKALGDFHVEDLGLDFLQGSVSTSMNVSASGEYGLILSSRKLWLTRMGEALGYC